MNIDLKKEQQATLARPRCTYSLAANFFFWSMDLLTGKKTTLAKAKLIEMLASIPYRAWEFRQYARLTRCFRNRDRVQKAQAIVAWSRAAQDNEYWHLRVIHEKMKEDGVKDAWYLFQPVTFLMVGFYIVFARMMALVSIRRAFLFNAEFEDHAEHVYAKLVEAHPEWEQQPLVNEQVKAYADLSNWADVFRRIGLDEREHRNQSFISCGQPESVVKY
jgi:ubiquinol oxidase